MHELILGMIIGAIGFAIIAAISKNRDRNAALHLKDLSESGRPMKDIEREEGYAGDPAEVMALIQTGRKIEAIKVIREMTGLGLKEAKDLADKMSRGDFSALEAKTPKGGGL
jgi:ribosomal protein L7/L12